MSRQHPAWRAAPVLGVLRAPVLLQAVAGLFLSLFFLLGSAEVRMVLYVVVLPLVVLVHGRLAMRLIRASPLAQATLALFLYISVSASWGSLGVIEALDHIRILLLTLGFMMVVMVAFDPEDGRPLGWLLVGLMAGCLLGAGVSAVVHLDAGDVTQRFRAIGLKQDLIGQITLYGVIATAALAVACRPPHPRVTVLLLAGATAIVLFVVWSQTRGTLLAVTAGGAVALVFGWHRLDRAMAVKIATAGLVAGLAILAAVIALEPWTFLLRGDSWRLEIWGQAVRWIAEAPVFGHGAISGLRYEVHQHEFRNAHNLYLDTAVSTGLIGLGLLLWVLGRSAWIAHGSRHTLHGLMALTMLATGATAGLTHFGRILENAGPTWLFLWFPVFLAAGLEARARLAGGAGNRPPAGQPPAGSV